jgi:ATP-dependent RNA helicase DeaD
VHYSVYFVIILNNFYIMNPILGHVYLLEFFMTPEFASFADLNLSAQLLKALEDMKFITPSPIQAKTIPLLLDGRDLIAQAQTGTGKTAAFALPILQKLKPDVRAVQALIIAPTRELAIQVAEQFKSLGAKQRVTVAVLCGGKDFPEQLKQLRDGAQIVVGTPGRILDHLNRGTLKLDQLSTFVVDEADEMLRMDFLDDVEVILSKLPAVRQIALFSATMPSRIRTIANNYLVNPMSVEIRSETATVKSVEQRFLFAANEQKPYALSRILETETFQGMIVFVRTKISAEKVAEILQKEGHRAMALHGDVTQALRERIIAQFREGAIDILVATDVAARGLDVERVTHVINYDVPQDCETYVHRIGRTGRAGRSGATILFITKKESRILNTIERHTRQRIEQMVIPTDHQIQKVRLQRFMDNITARLQNTHLPEYQRIIETYLQENPAASPVEVASAIALLHNQDKPWHRESTLPKPARAAKEGRVQGEFKSSSRGSFERDRGERGEKHNFREDQQELFRLDVGRVHGVKPGNIVGAIANEGGLQSRFITGLKIHDDHSTVRLPKNMPKEAFRDLNKARVCGRQLKLTPVSA